MNGKFSKVFAVSLLAAFAAQAFGVNWTIVAPDGSYVKTVASIPCNGATNAMMGYGYSVEIRRADNVAVSSSDSIGAIESWTTSCPRPDVAGEWPVGTLHVHLSPPTGHTVTDNDKTFTVTAQ